MMADLLALLAPPGCRHGSALKTLDGRCVLCPGPLDEIPPVVVLSAPAEAPEVAQDTTHDGAAQALDALDLALADPALAAELLRRVNEQLGRASLFDFFSQAWSHELGTEPLDAAPHVRAFCDLVQAMLEGQLVATGRGTPEMRARVEESWRRHGLTPRAGSLLVQNLIANIPPSTLKSSILMVAAPAWMWLHWPDWSCACTSGVKENVDRDSNATRDLVCSEWYRGTFAIAWSIRKEVDSVGKWETTAGGIRISKKVLGSWTGFHVDAIFVDDPDDANQVHSEPARKRVHNKWRRAIRNRIKHGDLTIRVVIQQRVHVEDLTGYLIAKGTWGPRRRQRWAWFVLPLEYGHGPKAAPTETPWGWRDWRTAVGEVLHPARFSPEMIADERVEKGSQDFEAQYNQNPETSDGGMFVRGRARFFVVEGVERGPAGRPTGCGQAEPLVLRKKNSGALDLDWLSLTVDATFGALGDNASAVSVLVVGGKDQRRYVFDDHTEPMTFTKTKTAIADMIRKWPIGRCLIEKKANGAAILEDLEDMLARGVVEEQADGTLKRRPILGPNGKPAHVPLEDVNPGAADKEGRAHAFVPTWEASLIHYADGAPWLDAHLQEVCNFPHARRRDRVDALGQCLAFYRADGVAARRAKSLGTW